MQATIHWFLFSVFFVFNRLAQADGDLPALEQVLGKKNIHHMIGSGSCSALIKLLPGNKDLFISQVTWNSYSGMLRVFKLYDIPVSVSGDKGKSHHQKAGLFTRNYPLLRADCKWASMRIIHVQSKLSHHNSTDSSLLRTILLVPLIS